MTTPSLSCLCIPVFSEFIESIREASDILCGQEQTFIYANHQDHGLPVFTTVSQDATLQCYIDLYTEMLKVWGLRLRLGKWHVPIRQVTGWMAERSNSASAQSEVAPLKSLGLVPEGALRHATPFAHPAPAKSSFDGGAGGATRAKYASRSGGATKAEYVCRLLLPGVRTGLSSQERIVYIYTLSHVHFMCLQIYFVLSAHIGYACFAFLACLLSQVCVYRHGICL